MRVLEYPVKLYFLHMELTPNNVLFTDDTKILPEVGDKVTCEFGYLGAEITTRVHSIGRFVDSSAYEVYLTGTVQVDDIDEVDIPGRDE